MAGDDMSRSDQSREKREQKEQRRRADNAKAHSAPPPADKSGSGKRRFRRLSRWLRRIAPFGGTGTGTGTGGKRAAVQRRQAAAALRHADDAPPQPQSAGTSTSPTKTAKAADTADTAAASPTKRRGGARSPTDEHATAPHSPAKAPHVSFARAVAVGVGAAPVPPACPLPADGAGGKPRSKPRTPNTHHNVASRRLLTLMTREKRRRVTVAKWRQSANANGTGAGAVCQSPPGASAASAEQHDDVDRALGSIAARSTDTPQPQQHTDDSAAAAHSPCPSTVGKEALDVSDKNMSSDDGGIFDPSTGFAPEAAPTFEATMMQVAADSGHRTGATGTGTGCSSEGGHSQVPRRKLLTDDRMPSENERDADVPVITDRHIAEFMLAHPTMRTLLHGDGMSKCHRLQPPPDTVDWEPGADLHTLVGRNNMFTDDKLLENTAWSTAMMVLQPTEETMTASRSSSRKAHIVTWAENKVQREDTFTPGAHYSQR